MTNLFESFPQTSKEEWVALLTKELKGESIDILQKIDPIEEIAFPSYIHRADADPAFSDPGLFPFTRSGKKENNQWNIATVFRCEEEVATNKTILDALMSGTEHVVLEAIFTNAIDFVTLLRDVDLAYCWVTFHANTLEQVRSFLEVTGGKNCRVQFAQPAPLIELVPSAGDDCKLFTVDAYSVQQAGGATWQEIGFALAEGHELLVQLLDKGIPLQQACSLIQFQFGLGNKYFFELSKFRAFRTCWSKVVESYSDAVETILPPTVVAKTGFVNISLKDPYTNLLRQTTEALSAAVAGVNDLIVQPYDWHSSAPNLAFTRRMATNISLILKEESYIQQVIDPAGGAYALDHLTHTIAERAWSIFQEIERNGGIQAAAARMALRQEIVAKAELRIAQLQSKKDKRIGINIFPNPDKVVGNWLDLPAAWDGITSLNLEQHYEQA